MVTNNDYNWDQEINDLTIKIPIEEGTHKNDIDIQCTTLNIKVFIKKKEVLSGEFAYNIQFDNSNVVFVIENNQLEITLDKEEKKWWDSLFKDSSKIDVSDIAQKKQTSFEDLDDEAKSLVSKMMYQQNKPKNNPLGNLNPETEELLKKIQEKEKLDLDSKSPHFEKDFSDENKEINE